LSRFTSAFRDAKLATVLASTKAASGALPPAICVVSFWVACSAGTFWNSMVMFGCSAVNSFASCFIPGSWPTQEVNETVTASSGSGTGPVPVDPAGSDVLPPPHAVRNRLAATVMSAPRAPALRADLDTVQLLAARDTAGHPIGSKRFACGA
jgi:hypothetical protein